MKSEATCALVQPHPPCANAYDVDPTGESSTEMSRDYSTKPRITNLDRAIIRSYLQQHDCDLPFEIRKHRKRSGRALGGEETRLLPRDLERRLSELPPACKRVFVGGDMVLLEAETSTVLDVMRDAHVLLE